MRSIASYLHIGALCPRETAILLASVCKQDLSFVLAHPEYELKPTQKKNLDSLLRRLQKGVPLAYLLGHKDFYNYRFLVSPAVLIPRPESEQIIEVGLAYANQHGHALFIDLGTGSGALIITIASELKRLTPPTYRRSKFFATDISSAALKIAKKNTHSLKLSPKISFAKGDLIAPLKSNILSSKLPLFIAANLPYLTPAERKQEPSIRFEPTLALVGGRDGLSLYRRLLKQLSTIKGHQFELMMEINPHQAPALIKIARDAFPKMKIKKVPDLSGRTRFIVLQNIF